MSPESIMSEVDPQDSNDLESEVDMSGRRGEEGDSADSDEDDTTRMNH